MRDTESKRASPKQSFHTAPPFFQHLIEWLNRLLAWQVDVTRHVYGSLANDEYRGLYIPDAEADLLCAMPAELAQPLAERRAELAQQRDAIAQAADDAYDHGSDVPILRLARFFQLSRFDQDVMLIALAPEIDLRYERLYAYIQDDVTKKRPTVDLALRLLCLSADERRAGRVAFGPDAPLRHQHMLHLVEDGQRHTPLLARYLKLDDRIVNELLGRSYRQQERPEQHAAAEATAIDPALLHIATRVVPARTFSTLILAPALVAQLRGVLATNANGTVVALQGQYGTGRRAIAEALCAEAGLGLVCVDLDAILHSDLPLLPLEYMRRIVREAALQQAAILWQGADQLLHGESTSSWRSAFLNALDTHNGVSFLAIERPWEARGALRHASFVRVELPPLSYGEREQVWKQRLNGDCPDETVLQALASTFRLSGGQIRDAATMARSLSHWRDGGQRQGPLAAHELFAACRAQSSGKLDTLAHKITATYRWGDIVLPPDQTSQLQEICIQVRHRRTVLESWGFDRHLAMGKGVNVLFAGQSGTGKTMAAEIIATDLGLELYKVDLSTMVSKYIGETEKNLDRVFTAAREANAMLFFDEADALFGKRSEVKDAHDRYANIEVGYLLQKMEEYDGVVILATNLRKNLDDAFVRRLHVAIDFPFPDHDDRLRIWHKVFPAAAPLGDDVDLAWLAKQFKLAGGNIRNIALLSAYLAAEDGGIIGMTHIARAIKREYQKLGKLVTATEFGQWMTTPQR